jgi:hypothetical protein
MRNRRARILVLAFFLIDTIRAFAEEVIRVDSLSWRRDAPLLSPNN